MPIPPALQHGLRIPVVAAPMFLVSGPDLVLAACRAGIVGAFPTPNARPIAVLEEWMTRITDGLVRARDEQPPESIGPWCANLVTHSSNTRLPEDLALVARFRPPIVVTALGSPKPALATVQGYGGLVVADVTTIALARKAAAAGVDGLACICSGAGGHTGALSPFAFVSAVREFFDGLVIVGGAISDGWGVAGAIAAGADLVYMGTRFIATAESMAQPAYKQMLVDSAAADIMYTNAFTGVNGNYLIPSVVRAGLDPANLPASDASKMNFGSDREAKAWRDIWGAGQGVGALRQVLPAAALVDRLEQEYLAAKAQLLSA